MAVGLGMLKAPERDTPAEQLVDWLELAAFFGDSEGINPLELVDQLDLDAEGDDPSFEEADAFREGLFSGINFEIARRIRALGESYPFCLANSGAIFRFEPSQPLQEAQSTYLFTLILSHSPTSVFLSQTAVPSAVELRAARDVFQICATVAAAGYTNGPSFSIGWPRPKKAKFLASLHVAWTHCGDGALYRRPPRSAPPQLKDDGIDILAFRIALDGGFTTGFLVGQVASGNDWEGKSAVAVAKLFIQEWFWRQPVTKAEPTTFIPFVLPADMDQSRRYWSVHEHIISRTRLAAFVAAGLRLARDKGVHVERNEEMYRVVDWVRRHRCAVGGISP